MATRSFVLMAFAIRNPSPLGMPCSPIGSKVKALSAGAVASLMLVILEQVKRAYGLRPFQGLARSPQPLVGYRLKAWTELDANRCDLVQPNPVLAFFHLQGDLFGWHHRVA